MLATAVCPSAAGTSAAKSTAAGTSSAAAARRRAHPRLERGAMSPPVRAVVPAKGCGMAHRERCATTHAAFFPCLVPPPAGLRLRPFPSRYPGCPLAQHVTTSTQGALRTNNPRATRRMVRSAQRELALRLRGAAGVFGAPAPELL